MVSLEEILFSLGLEHQESKIYLASIKLGTSPASILARQCGIPRSTARYTCEELVQKQLMIEFKKGNTKFFTAEAPEKLQKLLDLQQETIEIRQQQLDVAMQDLKRLYNPYIILPKVQFFEGIDGVIKLIEDVFKENMPIFGALSLTEDTHPKIFEYLEQSYTPKRKQMGNSAWMIFNDNKLTKEYQNKDREMNRISLLISKEDFPFDSCCHIYNGKVAFYSYNKNNPMGVIIQNNLIYKSQMSIFKLAWEYAKNQKINKQYSNIELPN